MPDYLIVTTIKATPTPTKTERLVRAKNEARALAHVVKDTVSCDRASPDDLIRLTKIGVDVEISE